MPAARERESDLVNLGSFRRPVIGRGEDAPGARGAQEEFDTRGEIVLGRNRAGRRTRMHRALRSQSRRFQCWARNYLNTSAGLSTFMAASPSGPLNSGNNIPTTPPAKACAPGRVLFSLDDPAAVVSGRLIPIRRTTGRGIKLYGLNPVQPALKSRSFERAFCFWPTGSFQPATPLGELGR